MGRYERMTVRQAFCALEVAGIVEKTEGGYRQVQTQLLAMRREDLLDWSFITDGTRWQRKPKSWDSAQDYIEAVARSYRRDLWRSQNVRIEVWLEKDALADVVVDVTAAWDVALMVSRGQSSATFLHSAAEDANAHWTMGTTTHIYALYDYDPGGRRAAEAIERELVGPSNPTWWGVPAGPVVFERLAVTAEQIDQWDLPGRPLKPKDPEAAKWREAGMGDCVELDAIPPERLTSLVEDAITSHIDEHAWELECAAEQEEREGLLALRATFNGKEAS